MMSTEEQPLPVAADPDEGAQFAVACARIAAENRSEGLVVLDVRGLCTFTDFFVIGTGTSDRQMEAVLDHIREYARGLDRSPIRKSNPRDGKWVLADYVDVVIHLFDAEHRDYYDLESLWGDAARVKWDPGADDPPRIARDPGEADDASAGPSGQGGR
jgi:ribosome-associated protein